MERSPIIAYEAFLRYLNTATLPHTTYTTTALEAFIESPHPCSTNTSQIAGEPQHAFPTR